MKKEKHIEEFTNTKGLGFHVIVSARINSKVKRIDGGRFYAKDYSTPTEALKEAKKSRDRILTEIDLGSYVTDIPTVGQLYEKKYELIPCSLKSRERHDTFYKAGIQAYENIRIDKLSAAQIQQSINDYSATHSYDMTKRLLGIWHLIYRTALLLQIPVIDRTQMVIVPKSKVLPKKRNTQTTTQDFYAFMEELQKYNDHSLYSQIVTYICWTLFYTGMRLQEALGLMNDDIDFKNNVIHVRRSVGSSRTELRQIIPLKTLKSERDIPIAQQFIPILERIMAMSDYDLLFCDPEGRPFDSDYISNYIYRVKQKTGIDFTVYSLRHLFATDMFRDGVNPKVIQNLLGHETENMSLYYAYTTPEEEKNAVKNRKLN